MRPLEGIKIVDFTQAYSGNFCAMHLADYGAEVIKIERYGSGDQAREWAPIKNGHSAYYATFCRGKKSLELNLRSEEGKEIIRQLVKEADVVTENFKVGSMDRLGLGYDELKKINPKIIYASISGYGLNGPMSKLPAYDNVTSAQSGIMDTSGFPDGPPLKIGPSIGDNYTGTSLFMGICLALYSREKTGKGQRLDVAMLDSLFSLMDSAVLQYTVLNEIPKRSGNCDPGFAPYDVLKTKDGYIAIGVATDKLWAYMCHAMNKEEWIDDPKYMTNENRVANYTELKPMIEGFTKQYDKMDLHQLFSNAGVPCGPVLTVPEVMNSPQIKDREMVVDIDDPGVGPMKAPGVPIKFSKTPGGVTGGSPLLGANTIEVLQSIGYSDTKITELKDQGIVNYLEYSLNA